MEEVKTNNTDYIDLETKDCKKAAYILSNDLNISNFRVIDDVLIRIYDLKVSQKEISKKLILNDIDISSINMKKTSLEDYFLNLLKGDGINV